MQQGDYLIEDYVSVTPGDPYRLFPFGKIVKDGQERLMTPELAAMFKLPHFKPPIKRGSHDDDAPAGGHIKALEVREDGLWAIPEFNEKGAQAIADGDYRYHSPEVIWSDGPVFEDPQGGPLIRGPLIVGDALLHTPHLGEAAALYSVEPLTEGNNMEDQNEMVTVPKPFWDEFMAKLPWNKPEVIEPELEPAPVEEIETEKFVALQAERDEFKAELDRMAAEAELKVRTEKYSAAISETKANKELVELLAGLDDETADRFVQEFKALSAQIDESKLTEEIGTEGDGLPEDSAEALNAAVLAKMQADGLTYNAAMALVIQEAPELVANYGG